MDVTEYKLQSGPTVTATLVPNKTRRTCEVENLFHCTACTEIPRQRNKKVRTVPYISWYLEGKCSLGTFNLQSTL